MALSPETSARQEPVEGFKSAQTKVFTLQKTLFSYQGLQYIHKHVLQFGFCAHADIHATTVVVHVALKGDKRVPSCITSNYRIRPLE